MANEIILYDCPSKGTPKCFSPNVWKTRAVLNYKSLPYRTEWLNYTALTPTFKSFGIPPNTAEECMFAYSFPAIKLPSGEYIKESLKIARKLEELQPSPPLHLDTPYVQRALDIVWQLQVALAPPLLQRVADHLINENDREFLIQERVKQMGRTPEEFANDPAFAGEAAWTKAESGLTALRKLLKENSEGPFIMGNAVSFADFVIVGCFEQLSSLDQDGDVYGRLMNVDASFPALRKACEPWFQRKD